MTKIAHHVFFTLKDRSDEKIAELLAACDKYLDNHDGLLSYCVGTRERSLVREVNQDFDVSLHLIFQDLAAHDVYQTAPRHVAFIAEQKESWADVRIWDSILRG